MLLKPHSIQIDSFDYYFLHFSHKITIDSVTESNSKIDANIDVNDDEDKEKCADFESIFATDRKLPTHIIIIKC